MFGCSDGAGNQVVDVTASFTLAGIQGRYTGSQPLIVNGKATRSPPRAESRPVTTTTAAAADHVNNLSVTGGNDGGHRGGAIRTTGPLG